MPRDLLLHLLAILAILIVTYIFYRNSPYFLFKKWANTAIVFHSLIEDLSIQLKEKYGENVRFEDIELEYREEHVEFKNKAEAYFVINTMCDRALIYYSKIFFPVSAVYFKKTELLKEKVLSLRSKLRMYIWEHKDELPYGT